MTFRRDIKRSLFSPVTMSQLIGRFVMSPGGVSMTDDVVTMLLAMGAFAVLIRRVGLDTVGLWALISALLNYSRIADLWSTGLLSFVGEARGRGNIREAAGFASTALTTGAIGYLLLIGTGGTLIYALAPHIVPEPQVATVRADMLLMVVSYWLIACAGNYFLAFVGFGHPVLRAVQNAGGALVFFLGCLVLPGDFGLAGILWVQALRGACMLLFGVVVFNFYVVRDVRRPIWEWQKVRQLAGFGSKLFATSAVQYSVDPMIKLLVSQFGGLVATGMLEVVMRLVQGVRGVILSLGRVFITSFARAGAEAGSLNHDILKREYTAAIGLMLPAIMSIFALLFAAEPIIAAFFLGGHSTSDPKAGPSLAVILWVFGLAWLSNDLSSPAYFLLMSRRRARPLFIAVVIRAILIGVVGTVLGRLIGIYGVFATVTVAFTASSFLLARSAGETMRQKWNHHLLHDYFLAHWSVFVPLIWIATLDLGIATLPAVLSNQTRMILDGFSLFSTFALVLLFGRLPLLYRRAVSIRI